MESPPWEKDPNLSTKQTSQTSTEDGDIAAPAQKPLRKTAGRKSLAPEVRERAILATKDVLSEQGLDGLKARIIATKAGISVGSIYNLFGDLDALARLANASAYDDLFEVESEALAHARKRNATPGAQMMALASAYLDFVVANQSRWLTVLAFNRSRSETPPAWYLAKEARLLEIIEDALLSFPRMQDKAVRKLHARALWASIHGIVTIAVADGFLMQPVTDVRQQIRIIVAAVAHTLDEIPNSK